MWKADLAAILQVAEELGDTVRIVKVDTDENPDVSSQLQVLPAVHNPALYQSRTIREHISLWAAWDWQDIEEKTPFNIITPWPQSIKSLKA